MKLSFPALGTTWWIDIFDEVDDKTYDFAFGKIVRFISQFENNYSRFKSDSQISSLNRERELKNPPKELQELLSYGKGLYLRTNTHFNILTGHVLEARGYDSEYSFKDTGSSSLIVGNPITDLIIDNDLIKLSNGNIDIGGFGKGYLIDMIAKKLQSEHGLKYFLINGGGDIYVTSNYDKPIKIHLEHPAEQNAYIATTDILNQGFAASSPHKRTWPTTDGNKNHIVSSTDVTDAVYIKSASCRDADAFATTILQLDKHETEKLAQEENLAVAKFDIKTLILTKTNNFI